MVPPPLTCIYLSPGTHLTPSLQGESGIHLKRSIYNHIYIHLPTRSTCLPERPVIHDYTHILQLTLECVRPTFALRLVAMKLSTSLQNSRNMKLVMHVPKSTHVFLCARY